MTEQQLKEIEARANAAAPGPWHVVLHCGGAPGEFWCIHTTTNEGDDEEASLPNWNKEDNLFVAHARTDVPALIEEVRRLRALIKQVEQVEGDFGDRFCPWCGCHTHDDCPAFTPEGDVR